MRDVLIVQNSRSGGPGRLGGWLGGAGLRPDGGPAHDRAPLPARLSHDAMIMLGGVFLPGDDDRAPWLATARSLFAQALDEGVPLFGICLGGQMLAEVAGGGGGVGPGGYDCSGFMSAILNVIQGKNPYQRRFTTFSFGNQGGPGGFVRNQRSGFMVGVENFGAGHMAGTLGGKLNVESRGSRGVLVGPAARGANDGLFTHRYGLKFDRGGMLPTGTSVVHNFTGKPEPVFTSRQMNSMGGPGGSMHIDTVNVYGVQDVSDLVEKIQKFAKDRGGIKLKIRA